MSRQSSSFPAALADKNTKKMIEETRKGGGYAHITSNAERANTDNQKYIVQMGVALSLAAVAGAREGWRPVPLIG